MSHCKTCPLTTGHRCPGETARRLCDLADPSHPDHRPAYRESISETARQLAAEAHYPSLAQQAASLASSLWDWACSGFSVAAQAEQEQRRATCRACPHFDGSKCRLCGCRLAAKIAMRTEHCPDGRW